MKLHFKRQFSECNNNETKEILMNQTLKRRTFIDHYSTMTATALADDTGAESVLAKTLAASADMTAVTAIPGDTHSAIE